jgi:hypothetical protein
MRRRVCEGRNLFYKFNSLFSITCLSLFPLFLHETYSNGSNLSVLFYFLCLAPFAVNAVKLSVHEIFISMKTFKRVYLFAFLPLVVVVDVPLPPPPTRTHTVNLNGGILIIKT